LSLGLDGTWTETRFLAGREIDQGADPGSSGHLSCNEGEKALAGVLG